MRYKGTSENCFIGHCDRLKISKMPRKIRKQYKSAKFINETGLTKNAEFLEVPIIFKVIFMKQSLPKLNLILIAVSFVIIIIGFALMVGAPSGEEYNPDIFSTRRITVGPMISLFGFVFMIFAILFSPKKK
jgi:high-affinity Fe2+/Pb2+ permease